MKFKIATLTLALLASGAVFAQASDTVAKVKASGVVTMGVRDSSGALSYTLGDGKYVGYHVEICQRILANLEKPLAASLKSNTSPSPRKTAFRWFKTARSILNAARPPTMQPGPRMWPSCTPPSSRKCALP